MPHNPVRLAEDLIRRRDVGSDAGALAYLRDVLTGLGFACTGLEFDGTHSLVARRGASGPHFCFCGHVDVTPPADEDFWTHPPFDSVIADGQLYGRGAAGMKGGIAAFIAGMSSYLERHGALTGFLSLLIAGDGQGPVSTGTVKALQWMRGQDCLADVWLVGEPSNPAALGDEIKIGRRGSLDGVLQVKGLPGLVAYPAQASNPLPGMVRLLNALAARIFDAGSAHFPATNLEITSIDTGNADPDVIPAACHATFNVRFNDRWTAVSLEGELRRVLDGCGEAYRLSCLSNAESFVTRPGVFTAQMSQAVEEITGHKPILSTSGGTSNARFIAAYGAVVEFGLIDEKAGQVDEHVAVDDLYTLARTYERMLELWFGR